MRSKRRWGGLVAAASCLALGGAAHAADAVSGRALTGPEIRAALLGNTAYGKTPSGERWNMWIAPDGKLTVRGTMMQGSIFGDVGTGAVEGNLWCVTWAFLRDGKKTCLTVTQDGDQYRNYAADGHLESTYTVRQGNTEGY
jgi:hypothetical protein